MGSFAGEVPAPRRRVHGGRGWCPACPQLPLWWLSQINKLHLCKPLIRAIDSSNLKDDYSTAQRVTFRYYVGRKAMFDSDFKQGWFVFVSWVLKTRGSGRRAVMPFVNT